MLFNSITYAIFLPIIVIIFYLLPRKARKFWLLLVSYGFYMSYEPKYTIYLFAITTLTYISARLIDEESKNIETEKGKRTRKNKIILITSICLSLLPLLYFKYWNFTLNNVNNIFRTLGSSKQFDLINVILPVGISFFTFQAIGYVIDVYRQEIDSEKDFITYALFISFFPQIVSGPIGRAKQLIGQIKDSHDLTGERLRTGVLYILFGLWLKMLIADNISNVITPVFNDCNTYNGIEIVISILLFSIQIYCDFSGYTYLALGSAKLFGIDLINNFSAPYMALSINEFWRRWHISLSSWFRDYIYISLGGNRKGSTRKRINTFIVFMVSGLWHGAAWNYVVWGGIHGIYLIIEDVLKKRGLNKKSIGKVDILIKRICTYLLVAFAFMFFRAPSLGKAMQMIKRAAANIGINEIYTHNAILNLFGNEYMAIVIMVAIVMLICLDAIQYKTGDLFDYLRLQKVYVRWGIYLILFLMIIIFGAYGEGYEQTSFIYFSF